MKYVLIMMLALMAAQAQAREPKFYKGQKVTYEVGFFLHKVCSGNAEIYEVHDGENGSYVYTITPPENESDCPSFIEKEESQIKAVSEK